MRHRFCVPTFGKHPHRNDILNQFARLSRLADRIDLPAQQFGLLVFRQFPLRPLGVFALLVGGRLLEEIVSVDPCLGFRQHFGIDVQRPLRCFQCIDANLAVVEGVFHARRGFRPIGDRDHHRRHGVSGPFPSFRRLLPIFAEQLIAIGHEVGQVLVLLRLAIQIVFYLVVVVEMIEPRFVVGRQPAVVANDHPRRFYQSRFDGVVQAEIAHDPAE